jgi:antitoxin PrlF
VGPEPGIPTGRAGGVGDQKLANRDRLGVRSGDRIEFVATENGYFVLAATQDIRAIRGIVPKPPEPVSVERMNRAISRMGAGR